MPSTLWPHIRALLIAAHIAAVIVSAFPSPSGGMTRSAWKDPTVQAELSVWAQRLSMETAVLEEHLWDLAVAFMSVRKTALKPFKPYYQHAGTYQAWHMFVAPHRNPAKLEIALDYGSEDWTLIYRARDPEYAWKAEVFDHNRARAALFRYSWKHYRTPYRQLTDWLAGQAAAEFPEAERIRLRWYRYRTLSPERVRAGEVSTGSHEREQIRYLRNFR